MIVIGRRMKRAMSSQRSSDGSSGRHRASGGACVYAARARDVCGSQGTGSLGLLLAIWASVVLAIIGAGPAIALDVIDVDPQTAVLELTERADLYEQRADNLPVDTAPNADGTVGRMVVRSVTPGTNPNWAVIALRNAGTRPIERWITADRYRAQGSGILFPDLDTPRLRRITPSIGFVPEPVPNDQIDIFRVTLAPGETVTYVIELASDRFPRLQLWAPSAFEESKRDQMLFNGVLLGVATLLAIFLTAIFTANHKPIFPLAAMIAWSVVAYLCVDFGFWHRLFRLDVADTAFWRAGAEAAIAASTVAFLFAFLRVANWHAWIRAVFAVWILGQLGVVTIALLDPTLGITLARLSFVIIAAFGSLAVGYLALRGQDRALSLVPLWLLFLVWIFGTAAALNGRLSGDFVVPSLLAGLVLILLLIGFTVTQFAFRSSQPLQAAAASEMQLRARAIDCAQSGYWEWNARRDEIITAPLIETQLELHPGELNTRTADWLTHVHPGDREKLRLLINAVEDQTAGRIDLTLRLRKADNTFRWFELRSMAFEDQTTRTLKSVGLLRDVTDNQRARERLLHDAVHDHLTGLPNRELFLDRLDTALREVADPAFGAPTIMLIDIDRFKNINSAFGLVVGDSMLKTVARRLQRHLSPQDTLARLGGDQFAVLIKQPMHPREVAQLAERCRRSLRSSMTLVGQEIVLTCSIGAARYDGLQAQATDMIREAENALYRAKRAGSDRTEIFMPSMRQETDDRVVLEAELRRAVTDGQFHLAYQPIVSLATSDLVGFEALLRWDNPRLGTLSPDAFVPMAEELGLMAPLGCQAVTMASESLASWHKLLKRSDNPLFVSVNMSTSELLRPDLLQDIRSILRRETVPPRCLKIELTESVVMGDPERAIHVLQALREAGASLAVDDFGSGFSSLAYLHRFAFDTIKIDRSLVSGVSGNDTAQAIIRSILVLARELKRDVVAEGVETYEDALALRTLGCHMAQGFYFAKPMAAAEAVDLMRSIARAERRSGRSSLFERMLSRPGRADTRGERAPQKGGASPSDALPDHETAESAAARARLGADPGSQEIVVEGVAEASTAGAGEGGPRFARAGETPDDGADAEMIVRGDDISGAHVRQPNRSPVDLPPTRPLPNSRDNIAGAGPKRAAAQHADTEDAASDRAGNGSASGGGRGPANAPPPPQFAGDGPAINGEARARTAQGAKETKGAKGTKGAQRGPKKQGRAQKSGPLDFKGALSSTWSRLRAAVPGTSATGGTSPAGDGKPPAAPARPAPPRATRPSKAATANGGPPRPQAPPAQRAGQPQSPQRPPAPPAPTAGSSNGAASHPPATPFAVAPPPPAGGAPVGAPENAGGVGAGTAGARTTAQPGIGTSPDAARPSPTPPPQFGTKPSLAANRRRDD